MKVQGEVQQYLSLRQCRMMAQAAGIDPQVPRKDWPRELLRQVVTELMRDAPKGMLAREILAGSVGPAGWYARQQAHARSSAVMSVVSADSHT